MNALRFGDIVLLKFPFTDGKQYKKRPALVICDTEDGDVLVCRITGQAYQTKFDFQLKEWKKNGLLLPSIVRVHKAASLDKQLVDGILGSISQSSKEKIEELWRSIPG